MAKDRYFEQLEDTVIAILKRVGNTGEITQTDIALLSIYNKEYKAQKGNSAFDSLFSNVKKILSFINSNLEGNK